MMKRIFFLLILSAMMSQTWGYDFMLDGIAYNINGDGKSVTVTYSDFANNYPGVTAITIPERVTRNKTEYIVSAVGSYAFYECTSLTSLNVPSTVKKIDEYAVFDCSKLSTLIIGNNVEKIGRYAFSGTAIKSLYLPGSVTNVGDYAFSESKYLNNAIVGSGVNTLGRSVFENCSALESVNLGVKLADIGYSCFSGCVKLQRIVCAMPEPPEISASVFEGVNKNTCKLHVPQGALEIYHSMDVWMDFKNLTNEYAGFLLSGRDLDCIRGKGQIKQGELLDTLAIELANDVSVTAIQFSLSLPQGLSFSMKNGEPEIWLSNRKAKDHNVTCSGDGRYYNILISSPSGKALSGSSGIVCYVLIKVSDSQSKSHTINLLRTSVAMPNSDWMNLPDTDSRLRVGFLLGDSNGDGAVDVADYVVTAARLINRPVNRFFLDATDVNRNGSVDIGDLVGITQRATGQLEPEKVF